MRLSVRFEQALTYAAQLHAPQERKGSGVPYVSHLMAVAALVLEYGDPLDEAYEDMAIAALLHDAIEDHPREGATRAEIAARFGERVQALVDGLSDSSAAVKAPWRPRKEAYLAHLPLAGREVLLVSASDKLHNARSILADHRVVGERIWERFKGGKDGSLWYYQALVDAYKASGQVPAPLLAELERTVAALVRMAEPAAS